MSTVTAEILEGQSVFPGTILLEAREKRGYSAEYVAGRLHLRVRVIELLEADDYAQLPEPVFVKGYIRAYAKLLDIEYQPLLQHFNENYKNEQRQDRTLWQSKREVNIGVHMVRWLTLISFVVVITAVGMWWHKAKDSLNLTKASQTIEEKSTQKVTLTDLSKMQTVVELPKKDSSSA